MQYNRNIFSRSEENTQIKIPLYHAEFSQKETLDFTERADVAEKIENYIFSGDKDVPLLVVGTSGCGRSSILFDLSKKLRKSQASNDEFESCSNKNDVFSYFTGAVPYSSQMQWLLFRLCNELDIHYDLSYHTSLSSIAQLCCKHLGKTSAKKSIVIVDALDGIIGESDAQILSWIPSKLAPNVKCVISLLNDCSLHRILMSRECKPQEIFIESLTSQEKLEIINSKLKDTPEKVIDLLLSKTCSENPLWLTFASWQLQNDSISLCERVALPDTLSKLLQGILKHMSNFSSGQLIVAALSLIEVSTTGLHVSELKILLADKNNLCPPSPFDEKDEKEYSEKECCSKNKYSLTHYQWNALYTHLQPFLSPSCDGYEGPMTFRHHSISEAVQLTYLVEESIDEMSEDDIEYNKKKHWHSKLAEFFELCMDVERKIEEYFYHLVQLGESEKLISTLSDWEVFDHLYNEEFSKQLLSFWRKAGGFDIMVESYNKMLQALEEKEPRDEHIISLRHECIAHIYLQAGKYSESRELTKIALKLEEKELGNRPERMVELLSLMAEIFNEKLKLNDFVSPNQLPDLRKTIRYGCKSIACRQKFTEKYHRFKLGLSLMKLAFSLESWDACGGDSELPPEQAVIEGNQHIDTAIEIFKELNDDGHFAEALMTKGVLAKRGSNVQLKLYKEAMELCSRVYGEFSLLASRLYINIGIVYEENKDYFKAFDYFQKWSKVTELVLGPEHPKTLRAKGVLREPRYVIIATHLKNKNLNISRILMPSLNDENQDNTAEEHDIDDENTASNSSNASASNDEIWSESDAYLLETNPLDLNQLNSNQNENILTNQVHEEIQDLCHAFTELFQRLTEQQLQLQQLSSLCQNDEDYDFENESLEYPDDRPA